MDELKSDKKYNEWKTLMFYYRLQMKSLEKEYDRGIINDSDFIDSQQIIMKNLYNNLEKLFTS